MAFAASAMLAFLFTGNVQAQEWTKAQKEVWKVVEDSWANWKKKDPSTMNYFHESYQGWNSEDPLPMGKTEVEKSFNASKDMMDIKYYTISPARIAVTDNAAVVHYYFSVYSTWKDGDKTTEHHHKGKYTEFYVKDGGSWKLLGDMTVEQKEDKED